MYLWVCDCPPLFVCWQDKKSAELLGRHFAQLYLVHQENEQCPVVQETKAIYCEDFSREETWREWTQPDFCFYQVFTMIFLPTGPLIWWLSWVPKIWCTKFFVPQVSYFWGVCIYIYSMFRHTQISYHVDSSNSNETYLLIIICDRNDPKLTHLLLYHLCVPFHDCSMKCLSYP